MRRLPATPVPVLPAPRRNRESWMIDASRVCPSPVPMGLSAADPARTRARTHTTQAPERVSGPVVGELSRARLNRLALARAIASLGMWAEKERAEKERERGAGGEGAGEAACQADGAPPTARHAVGAGRHR